MGIVTRGKGNKYLRLVVPRKLRDRLGRRDIFKSLGTDSERLARRIESGFDHRQFWDEAEALAPPAYPPQEIGLALTALLERHLGSPGVEHLPVSFPPQPAAPDLPSSKPRIRLSELASIRLRQLKATGRAVKTLMAAESQYRQVVSIMGDMPLDQYEHEDFLCLQEALQKRFAVRTAYGRLITTATLFRYAIDHGYLDRNPCPRFEKPKVLKRATGWQPYDTEDLQRLLASPYFKGGIPDHRGWACLISLFSGLRLDEVCQLHTEDLMEREGILCFSVNDEGDKKVKSDSSIRLVPIHSFLLRMGLERLGDGVRLFPQFVNQGMGYSHNFSKAFGKFNRRHISRDTSKVFHSFRKTFSRELAKARVHQETIGALLGHRAASEVTALYSGGVALTTLQDAIARLRFEDILTKGV